MQQNSFFLGCNYSNRDTTDARTGWSSCPVQDIDTALTNRCGVNVNVNADDTLSLLYYDLYLRQQLKETLKHTMLVHESVFESQIHELHRLYWRQKELMMEMERTRHHEALYLNSGFPSHRTHWMNSGISTYQNRNLRCEEYIPNQIESVDNVEKSEKKVLDLELPDFEYNDREEERGSVNGEVDVVPNFLKKQSLESGKQSSKLQLDLNEPAKIDEQSDYVFNQFPSPVTSNENGEESDSLKGSKGMNEMQGSVKCRGEYGIDLNMSPLSSDEDEEIIAKKFETKKAQESLSDSLHGNHEIDQPRVVVQALPCSSSILLLAKQYKPLMRGSRPRKKVKLGPNNKTFEGSDLDLHLSAQAISESLSNQAIMEKVSSSSSSKVKSARNWTNLGKKRCCEPQMKSSKAYKVVAKKNGRTKRKKSRRISLVKEGHYQEVSAAEAIVDISRKSGRETADCIASLSIDLLWFAEISSSVAEDYEIDSLETMAEMKLEKHKKNLRLNSSGKKTAASSFVLGKQKRSRSRQGKRKCKDDQDGDNPSLGSFSECEANEDLQVVGKLIETSELQWSRGFLKDKSKSSLPKLIDAFASSVEEKTSVDWGAIKKRRRGSRIPATDFQHMIINQVV